VLTQDMWKEHNSKIKWGTECLGNKRTLFGLGFTVLFQWVHKWPFPSNLLHWKITGSWCKWTARLEQKTKQKQTNNNKNNILTHMPILHIKKCSEMVSGVWTFLLLSAYISSGLSQPERREETLKGYYYHPRASKNHHVPVSGAITL